MDKRNEYSNKYISYLFCSVWCIEDLSENELNFKCFVVHVQSMKNCKEEGKKRIQSII